MLTITHGLRDPELVARVQAFRGRIYFDDGAIPELTDGRHIEAADTEGYHLVVTHAGEIRACLRYLQMGEGRARVGGWAVAPEARYAGLQLVLEAVKLAARLGDHYATATATTRHDSNKILRKMGGRSIMLYYDPAYRCEMELLEFHLSDFGLAMPLAA